MDFSVSILFLYIVYAKPIKIQLSSQNIKWLSPKSLGAKWCFILFCLSLSAKTFAFFLWENLVVFAFSQMDFQFPLVKNVFCWL